MLERVSERAGLDALTLAVTYHAARDLFPHNPRHRVRILEPGAAYYRPDERRWEGRRLRPRVSSLVGHGDPLAELCAAAPERGLGVRAWLVLLHEDRLGFAHPDCAPENAFGDPYGTDLCPANPHVRDYARALVGDVARPELEAVRLESVGYPSVPHGDHHERLFLDLGPLGLFLLSLCFCKHCRANAERDGVQAERVRADVRRRLDDLLTGRTRPEPHEFSRDDVASLAGGEMASFLDARERVVGSLVGELAAAAANEGSRVDVLDLAGAELGYAHGKPTGPPAPARSWRNGLDPHGLADAGAGVVALGYARDPERVRADLAAYSAATPPGNEPRLCLRPLPPDCPSAANLAAKVGIAREAGVAELDFYHYGFARLTALDWIREALSPEGSY